MILADVNILVYSFDSMSAHHDRYLSWLNRAVSGADSFALVDTVLSGFLRVISNPAIYASPAPVSEALAFVDQLIEAPASVWLPGSSAAWRKLAELASDDSAIRGKLIPDAYLASLAIANGATLATADRGFSRYPGLNWFDPARP